MENIKEEKKLTIECVDCGKERIIKKRYENSIIRCESCQSEKIKSSRLAYSADKLTANEINLISNYDHVKLQKYYHAALKRDNWGLIDKRQVFKYCERVLKGVKI